MIIVGKVQAKRFESRSMQPFANSMITDFLSDISFFLTTKKIIKKEYNYTRTKLDRLDMRYCFPECLFVLSRTKRHFAIVNTLRY